MVYPWHQLTRASLPWQFLFTLFAGVYGDQLLLDYTEMLLYFASDPDAIDGVYRALSVATGTYTHRIKEKHVVPQVVKKRDTVLLPICY